jgi:predicted transcriptional regulator
MDIMKQNSSPDTPADDLTALTAEITAGYLRGNRLPAAGIPEVISLVHDALRQLGQPAVPEKEPQRPAVPIRKSVTAEYIVCLEDGRKLKMLKRHLRSTYGMTPDEYRAKWNLPADYPMVAPAYAEKRSEFAKAIGLGRSRSEPEPEPEAVPARRGRPRAA